MTEKQTVDALRKVAALKADKLPAQLVLGPGELIVDVKKFIDSHLCIVRKYWNNTVLRKPYLDRLLNVYAIINPKKA